MPAAWAASGLDGRAQELEGEKAELGAGTPRGESSVREGPGAGGAARGPLRPLRRARGPGPQLRGSPVAPGGPRGALGTCPHPPAV